MKPALSFLLFLIVGSLASSEVSASGVATLEAPEVDVNAAVDVTDALPEQQSHRKDYSVRCCMCDSCRPILFGRANTRVTSTGGTCRTMALKMASMRPGTYCSRYVNQFRNTCCNANYTPKQVAQQRVANPSLAANQKYGFGQEPICHICADASFPKSPNTVCALLYMPGNPTCRDLYYMGRRGRILDRLCNAAQDFFQAPCGCPKH